MCFDGFRKAVVLSVILLFIGIDPSLTLAQELKVKVTALSSTKTALPGDFVTCVFTVANQGNLEDSYKLKIELPEKWNIIGALNPVALSPDREEKVFVTVAVSFTTLAQKYEIELTAISQAHNLTVSDSAIAIIEVKEFASVKVRALSEGGKVKGGEEVSYSFLIINRGNAVDKFRISAYSVHKWKIILSEELIELAPGEQKKVLVILLVPKDARGGREYVILKATSLKDESVSDEADVSTTVLPPPPERVRGTLLKQVPASISLSGSGSITREEYSGWGGFNAGGDLGKGCWFNVYAGVPYEEEKIKKPHLTLDYGVRERWDLTLGDVFADFSELTELTGRGARFHTRIGQSSDFSLIWAKEEEKDRYGANLSKDIGERTSLGLNYFTFSKGNITSFQLNHNLTKKWSISGEYALSEGKENSDSASWISSKFEGENLILNTEYIKTGTNYLGPRKDEEGAGISSEYRPSEPLLLGLSLRHSSNNVNQDPTLPTVITDGVGVSSSLYLKKLPSLRLGYNTTKKKSKGLPPFTDEQKVIFSAGVSGYLRPFAYSFFKEWGKKNDYIEGTEFDLTGYKGRLSIYLGRLSSWVQYSKDIEQEVTKGTKEEPITQEVGLNYEIMPRKFSIFAGWTKEREEEISETISLGTNFRLSLNTYLSLGVEREESKLSEVDWTVSFSLDRSFGLPIPWIKTKGRIEGLVFIDRNENGSLDEDEEGIKELILTVNGMQAITGEEGEFRFPPLEPGHYGLNLEDIPAGLESGIALPCRVSLTAGEIVEVNIPLIEVSSVMGIVFNDENKNGVRDKGEIGIPNVRITFASEGAPQKTFTNPNGRFFFTVPPGSHEIRIDRSSLPKRYALTTEGEYSITLAIRERTSVSFGAWYKPREIIVTFQAPYTNFSFNPSDPKSGQTVTFDASASSAFSGKIAKYEWDFDEDGKIDATGKIVKYSFPTSGDYSVTLTVTDESGATDSGTKTVTTGAITAALKPAALNKSTDNPANSPVSNKSIVASSALNTKIVTEVVKKKMSNSPVPFQETFLASPQLSDKTPQYKNNEPEKGKNKVASSEASEMPIADTIPSGQCEIGDQGEPPYLSNREKSEIFKLNPLFIVTIEGVVEDWAEETSIYLARKLLENNIAVTLEIIPYNENVPLRSSSNLVTELKKLYLKYPDQLEFALQGLKDQRYELDTSLEEQVRILSQAQAIFAQAFNKESDKNKIFPITLVPPYWHYNEETFQAAKLVGLKIIIAGEFQKDDQGFTLLEDGIIEIKPDEEGNLVNDWTRVRIRPVKEIISSLEKIIGKSETDPLVLTINSGALFLKLGEREAERYIDQLVNALNQLRGKYDAEFTTPTGFYESLNLLL